MTRRPLTFSDDVSFSCAGSRVIVTGQPGASRPSATESLWIAPSGDAVKTKRRDGSAAGLAFVICAVPATRPNDAGVNVQRIAPERRATATVLPYVVVAEPVSPRRIGVLSMVPGTRTWRRFSPATVAAVMPVAALVALGRDRVKPNMGQSVSRRAVWAG